MNKAEFSFDEENQIIVVAFHGEYKIDRSNPQIESFFQKAASYNCTRLLIDFTDTIVNTTIIDILTSVKNTETKAHTNKWKFAILDPKNDPKIAFLETASTNRSFNTKLFTNRTEAVNWLTGKTT